MKIKNKFPVLNQNSYLVSKKKIENLQLRFRKNINRDINNTLNLLKKLY